MSCFYLANFYFEMNVYNFPAHLSPSFGNQRILSYGCVWHKAKIVFVEKYTCSLISWFLAILGVSACVHVNVFGLGLDNQWIDSQ